MSMKVGVVGFGKLGLPLALVFCRAGIEVRGVDVDPEIVRKIEERKKLRDGHLFREVNVDQYVEDYGDRLEVSTNFGVLKGSEVVFVITQTPSLPNGKFDLQYVESAVKKAHEVNPDSVVAVSSNINIGDIGRLKEIHHDICYNPEFIKQGTIIHDFESPDFTLIGCDEDHVGSAVRKVWQRVHNKPIHMVSSIEAEVIKLSLNVSYTLGITFANIIGEICETFAADANKVLGIIYQDRRNYKPGLGFAGPCFPRDVRCFRGTCGEKDILSGLSFATLLENLNQDTMKRHQEKIKSYGKKNLGFLGVAYKPGVPYVYESQSLNIARSLAQEGYNIFVYDPLAEEEAKKVLPEAKYCRSVRDVLLKAEVLFIGTSEFKAVETDKPIVNPWI